jgi:hypothetical protein
MNVQAARALREYIATAGLTSGPLFSPRLNQRSKKLSPDRMSYHTAYRLLQRYFAELPGALKEVAGDGGPVRKKCIYTPHSTRASCGPSVSANQQCFSLDRI